MATPNLNLLRESNALPPQVAKLSEQMTKAGMILLSTTLGIGMIAGIIYGIVTFQWQSLTKQQADLTTAVRRQAKKEVLFLSLKERVALVKKVHDTQKTWTPFMDIVSSLASRQELTSLSFKEDQVAVGIKVPTIEDVQSRIGVVMNQALSGKYNKPQLNSLAIDDKEGVVFGISFDPLF